MSISLACNKETSVVNTGVECGAALGTDNTHLLIPKGATFTKTEITNAGGLMNLFQKKIHDNGSARWIPLGNNAAFKINDIQDSTEDATYETLPDGTKIKLKGAMYNRTYLTKAGGFCLAHKLLSISSDYDLIILDDERQAGLKKVNDTTYGGMAIQDFEGLPATPANYAAGFKNRWKISIADSDYVSVHVYKLSTDEDTTLLKGLVDSEPTESATPNTTAYIYFGAKTECAETDLVNLLGAPLVAAANFIIKKVETGATETVTLSITGGQIRAAGTFTSGKDYTVEFAPTATLYANSIIGYAGAKVLTTSIP